MKVAIVGHMMIRDRPLVRDGDDAYYVMHTESSAVLDALGHGFNIAVSGARGSGKTSLLAHLARKMRDDDRAGDAKMVPAAVHFVQAEEVRSAAALMAAIAEDIVGPHLKRRAKSRLSKMVELAEGALEPAPSLRGSIVADAARLVAELDDALAPGGYLAPDSFEDDFDHDVVIVVDGPTRKVVSELFDGFASVLERVPARWVVAVSDVGSHGIDLTSRFFEVHRHLGNLSRANAVDIVASRMGLDDVDARAFLGEAQVEELTAGQFIAVLKAAALKPSGQTEALTARRSKLDAKVHGLGRAAAMLVAEMKTLGSVSASDEQLLSRMGWQRARASEVLNALQREGLVTSVEEAGPGGGRPRRLYMLVDELRQ